MPIAHLSDRAVVKMSGPDVQAFLQGQLTNDIHRLTPDTPLYAGILTPQGKALFPVLLFTDGADVWVDIAASSADALIRRLSMFRLRRQVEIAPAPDLAVYAGWDEDIPHTPDPRLAALGSRWLAAADSVGVTADVDAWHRHRLALGVPDADETGDGELMWLETNGHELNGTSFTKGCYTGQENVARMHYRDKLRRRLLPLDLGDATEDAAVMVGDRNAGSLRGRRHGRLRMAHLRMEYVSQPLTVGGKPVTAVMPEWLSDPELSP